LTNESVSHSLVPILLFLLTYQSNLDRLDGLCPRRNSLSILPSPPLEKRLNNTTISIDEQQSNDLSPNLQSKKKKVRWADIEENTLHLHKKAGRFSSKIKNFLTLFLLFSWFCRWSNRTRLATNE
jgi:hypothetical protein